MSTLDSSSGDVQDQSEGSYSPHPYTCTSSPASAVGLGGTMQIQPDEASKSPHSCPSSPSTASSHDAPCSPNPALYHEGPNSPPASSDAAALTIPPSVSPTASTAPKGCSKDASGLQYPAAETYLMHPEILALMAGSSNDPPTNPPSASPTGSPAPEVCSKDPTGLLYPTPGTYLMHPEILALMAGSSNDPKPRTSFDSQIASHHLTLLNQESQMRGLTPRFEIEGSDHMGFGGNVKIGERTVTTENRWRSKKAAKQALAEKALDFVKELPSQKKKRPAAEPEQSWTGLLDEYHLPTVATTGGPVFFEYTRGESFACTCRIPAHPNLFGSESSPVFPTKKAARSNAAKEAMQFLIAQGLASLDSSDAIFRQEGSKRAKMDLLAEDAEASFGKKVNELCPLLSLPVPEYRLVASDSPPILFSGGAHFPASTPPGLLPTLGPIGSVKDVSGRKAAKNQCAELVLGFLMEWKKSQDECKIKGKEASGGDGKVETGGGSGDGGLGEKKQG